MEKRFRQIKSWHKNSSKITQAKEDYWCQRFKRWYLIGWLDVILWMSHRCNCFGCIGLSVFSCCGSFENHDWNSQTYITQKQTPPACYLIDLAQWLHLHIEVSNPLQGSEGQQMEILSAPAAEQWDSSASCPGQPAIGMQAHQRSWLMRLCLLEKWSAPGHMWMQVHHHSYSLKHWLL